MSNKLYPPRISGTIPAFTTKEDGGTTTIVVPFSMNQGVGKNQVLGFSLKIKNVLGEYIATATTSSNQNVASILENGEAEFFISGDIFKPAIGQYYKFQLAYIDSTGVQGYYSTIGIAKCTYEPEVFIESLEKNTINLNIYNYIGVYKNEKDPTEKLYSSNFILYDNKYNIIKQSEDILHNITEDDLQDEAHESYVISQDLEKEDNTIYYFEFNITTTNGYKKSSPKYKLTKQHYLPTECNFGVLAENNFDEGFIELCLIENQQGKLDKKLNGLFLISRASSLENYVWKELKRIEFVNDSILNWSYKDCNVQQGVYYKYSIQQYNQDGLYSERIISNEELCDFEDTFLYDGERQLKIRFNSKVSSFKNTILENKTDTIGSKFPFFYRNGIVNYKDFPISGLISYQTDPSELFMTRKELQLPEKDLLQLTREGYDNLDILQKEAFDNFMLDYYRPSDLTKENFLAERLFKLKVLEFLTNGKDKLFKSPSEGNYIVKLMNTSFSPNDTTGRMIHNFSCNAYETMECTYENLVSCNIIDASAEKVNKIFWKTVNLKEQYIESAEKDQWVELLKNGSTNKLELRDLMPGTKIRVAQGGNEIEIIIGRTGAYFYEGIEPITSLQVQNSVIKDLNSTLLYSYETLESDTFNNIRGIKTEDIPLLQYIGNRYQKENYMFDNKNLLYLIKNKHKRPIGYNFIRFYSRGIAVLYTSEENRDKIETDKDINGINFYSDMYLTKNKSLNLDNWLLYKIRYVPTYENCNGDTNNLLQKEKENKHIYRNDVSKEEDYKFSKFLLDGRSLKLLNNNLNTFSVDLKIYESGIKEPIDKKIFVKDKIDKPYVIDGLLTNNITSIIPHEGVVTEISCMLESFDFNSEIKNDELKEKKQQYLNALENFITIRANDTSGIGEKEVRDKYYLYLKELEKEEGVLTDDEISFT